MKYLTLVLVFISTIIFTGCTTKKDELPNDISDSPDYELIDNEFERISNLLLEEIQEDFLLPHSSDLFTVVYRTEFNVLDDNILIFEEYAADTLQVLKINISYEDLDKSYEVGIVHKGNLSLLPDEMMRIVGELPYQYSEDVWLPASLNGYVVEYFINGELVQDMKIDFEMMPFDKEIEMVVKLHFKSAFQEMIVPLVQKGDLDLYNEYMENQYFLDIFKEIDMLLPSVLVSNYTLPFSNDDTVNVSYGADCTDIVRNRIVYTFPETNQDCTVTAVVSNSTGFRGETFNIIMSAFDELPKIPSLYIVTEDNQEILSRDEYVYGYVNVDPGDSDFGQVNYIPMKIRLRGNSTSGMPKKPYKIKFDEPFALLSDYAEKDWVLLANYVDQTLVRDYLAFSMAEKLNMAFAPSFTLVDVYVNGEYQGNYLLTDQVEVTNNRVDIEENVPSIDTGYLVEYDWGVYKPENIDNGDNFFLVDNIPFVIKSPQYDDDHYSEDHKTFIKNYFEEVIDTLKNKEDYSNLIDESTFIDWFIVNEIFKNVDSGYSSIYFYKDKGGLLKMGPVWDLDISSGVPGYLPEDQRSPEGWYTARGDKNIFFYYLMQYPEFKSNLKDRWNEVYEDAIYSVIEETLFAADSMTQSRYNNFELWDIIGNDYSWYTSPEVYALKTYDEQVWFLHDFLKTRIEWMNIEINKFN